MTQIEQVLEYLKEHGSITSMDAIVEFGCTRLAAKVFELRKQGYNIETIKEKGKRGYYARYKLSTDTSDKVQTTLLG